DVLFDLSFSPSPALAPHFHAICSFGLYCMTATNEQLDIRVRDSGYCAVFRQTQITNSISLVTQIN
ncbi:MAG: hypothetical protein AAF518_28110, partial [Spirochaetota bacterium]